MQRRWVSSMLVGAAALVIITGCGAGVHPKRANRKAPAPGIGAAQAALRKGDLRAVEDALTADPRLATWKDSDGRTLLHRAALDASKEMITLLVARGTDRNAKDAAGLTPLHLAALRGRADIIQALLATGADANPRTTERTSVTRRVVEPNLGPVSESVGIEPGCTPLHLAAFASTSEADSNASGGRDGEVASAAQVAAELLSRGADVNAVDAQGKTPLHYAALYCRQADLVDTLIGHGALLTTASKDGLSPLHDAARLGNLEVVKVLLAKGVDPDLRDKSMSRTPLHWAAKEAQAGTTDVAAMLLSRGAKVNARDAAGQTPTGLAGSPARRALGGDKMYRFLRGQGGR